MILQNVIFPDSVCDRYEMYFHSGMETQARNDESEYQDVCPDKENADNGMHLNISDWIQTDTYMNAFPVLYWKTYTDLETCALQLDLCGAFKVQILCRVGQTEWICAEQIVRQKERGTAVLDITGYLQTGNLFFRLEALEDSIFFGACYTTVQPVNAEIYLAVNICTYHRLKQVANNLNTFLESQFFNMDAIQYGHLKLYVTDNGDDLEDLYFIDGLKILQNFNCGGGTGGFTRGLQEILQDQESFPSTHVVFMDDDVEFRIESFYRLHAYLSYLKPKYKSRGIAGRMFRMDHKQIQYTAAENWNGGDIFHVGEDQDMLLTKNAPVSELDTGDYGGWWLCAYPVETVRRQKPFPFFIHCDDVEYGLRQKEEVLTLPGFQVWHETFEYRQSLRVLYYDIRNAAIVNLLYGYYRFPEDMISNWKKRMDAFHNQQKWKEKYICALAMWHVCTGKKISKNSGDGSGPAFELAQKEHMVRWLTPLLHRIITLHIKMDFEIIKNRYQKLQEDMIWQ